MLNLIKYIICISAFCVVTVPAYKHCVRNFKILNWEFDDESPSPANLTQSFKRNETRIEVWLKERREDFNLTLLANPFIRNESDCYMPLRENKGLRQYFNTCIIFKDNDESMSTQFAKIFTGCYYFIMTNKEGKNWRIDPVFYKTNYTYLDTKLTVSRKTNTKPANKDTSIELITELKVPLRCLQVKAQLFEFNKNISDPMSDIKSGKIPPSQQCFISRVYVEKSNQCGMSSLITNLTLEVRSDEGDDDWKVVIVWKKLQPGGGQYYLHFMSDLTSCIDIYHRANTDTWRPLVKDIWVLHGLADADNTHITTTSHNSKDFPWVLVVNVILVFIVIGILIHWLLKYRKLIIKNTLRTNQNFENPQETVVPLLDRKESNQILLMYVKGLPLFMREMSTLRVCLEQSCNCHVHDLYATSEWNMIRALGASGWVEQLLRDESKVVWVDTPEFRSRFNNKQSQFIADDFRDEAVPYAVTLATTLFQNATTQYRQHFVVWMEGFEVEDCIDDPLLVVSPHARYSIPKQLLLLCEDLRSSMKFLEDKETEE